MSHKGLLLFLTVGLVWGIPYLLIKIVVEDFSAPAVVFARTAIGALVLIPLAIQRKAIMPAVRQWRVVVAFALFELIGPWWLVSTAENGHINSGLAGLLISTVPFFGLLLGYFYMGDRTVTGVKSISGLIIGFAGIGLLVGVDAYSEQLELVWVFALILAAVGYAVAPAVVSKNAPDVDSVGVIGLAMAFTAAVYAVPTAFQPLAVGVVSPKLESWLALAVLGVVCSSLAFVLFFALIDEVGYARSTLITYMNTAVAILAGVIFGNEPFTIGMAIGLPLVTIGSYLASQRGKQSKPSSTSEDS